MRIVSALLTGAAAALTFALHAPGAQAGQTFDNVKQKGFVQCGVNTSASPASPRPTTRATGPASTSTSAGPSPRRSSATPTRSSTRR